MDTTGNQEIIFHSPEISTSLTNIERNEETLQGIKIVNLKGDVIGKKEAEKIVEDEMGRLGITKDPNQYLIRQVRTTLLEKLLSEGCERDSNSYRDPILEADFNLSPNDYTYAHSYTGDAHRYIQNASYMIEGGGRTSTVFYKRDSLKPHHEEKYDAASNLGMGPTAVTYSFIDPENKKNAIYAVMTYQGKFAMDYYQYALELMDEGKANEAITAFNKFISAPPTEWREEEKQKWTLKAKQYISSLKNPE